MKIAKQTSDALKGVRFLVLVTLIFFATNVQSQDNMKKDTIYWHVKALLPEAKLLDIKAIDADGVYHDVKAIQDSDDISLLSVNALVNGRALPIKMIVKGNDKYYPIKAITADGSILDIKAIGKDGVLLDVKGVSRMGNIVHIRAIDKEQRQYNVISISPQEGVNHVKGVKMFNEEVEGVINGVKIFAHVKSLGQY